MDDYNDAAFYYRDYIFRGATNYDDDDDDAVFSIKRGGMQYVMSEETKRSFEIMKTNDAILAEAQALREQAEQLEAVAASREKYGEDPFRNGTVLKIDMKYRGSNRSYAYAAVKIAGKYYLSGRMGGGEMASTGYTWENFVAWLAQGDATVWQAGALKQVL